MIIFIEKITLKRNNIWNHRNITTHIANEQFLFKPEGSRANQAVYDITSRTHQKRIAISTKLSSMKKNQST